MGLRCERAVHRLWFRRRGIYVGEGEKHLVDRLKDTKAVRNPQNKEGKGEKKGTTRESATCPKQRKNSS